MIDLLREIDTSPAGLANSEAARRLRQYGANTLQARRRTDTLSLLRAAASRWLSVR